MATSNSTDGSSSNNNQQTFSPYVVVKFQDHIYIPYEDGAEKYIEILKIGPWTELTREFPGVSFKRLFTFVVPARMEELVNQAARRYPSYLRPSFFTFFAIECPVGVLPEALAKALSSWPNVQAAYVGGAPMPPPAFC